jgi:hypothetical protein
MDVKKSVLVRICTSQPCNFTVQTASEFSSKNRCSVLHVLLHVRSLRILIASAKYSALHSTLHSNTAPREIMMNDTDDVNEDLDDETADSNAKDEKQQEQQHVVVVCDRQQLNLMMLFGVGIILVAVVIGSVCGSGLCSSSSSSNASSTSSTSRGDMPVGVNSTVQAPMNMVNSSTPMMTPTSSISNPPSAFQSPTRQPSQTVSVVTPSPISVGVSTLSPTQSPIPFLQLPVLPTNPPSPGVSPTLQNIQTRGYLLCGAYDITLFKKAGFSADLVSFGETCSLVNIWELELFPSGTFPSSPHFCLFVFILEILGCLSNKCKALAAAIFGPTNITDHYSLVEELTPLDRFTNLKDKKFDVLVGFTSYTMERQVHEVRFSLCLINCLLFVDVASAQLKLKDAPYYVFLILT